MNCYKSLFLEVEAIANSPNTPFGDLKVLLKRVRGSDSDNSEGKTSITPAPRLSHVSQSSTVLTSPCSVAVNINSESSSVLEVSHILIPPASTDLLHDPIAGVIDIDDITFNDLRDFIFTPTSSDSETNSYDDYNIREKKRRSTIS